MIVNVKDGPFLAAGDGVTDDRTALQAAITAVAAAGGGIVRIPTGVYMVSQAPYTFQCLLVPGNVTLEGDGTGATTLKQLGGMYTSVRLIRTGGPNIRIRDLTLDGNKDLQTTASEHRHGLIAWDSPRLTLERVVSRNFTGDGF